MSQDTKQHCLKLLSEIQLAGLPAPELNYLIAGERYDLAWPNHYFAVQIVPGSPNMSETIKTKVTNPNWPTEPNAYIDPWRPVIMYADAIQNYASWHVEQIRRHLGEPPADLYIERVWASFRKSAAPSLVWLVWWIDGQPVRATAWETRLVVEFGEYVQQMGLVEVGQ